MVFSTLAVRRRTHVERRVLALMRGEITSSAAMPRRSARASAAPQASPALLEDLAELRDEASAFGLPIQPPKTAYVSQAELTVLAWLAEAQRVGARSPTDLDVLNAAIRRCATGLNALGLRLSPITLYALRIPNDPRQP